MMRHGRAGTVLVTIHDVAPVFRPAVDRLVEWLRRNGCHRPALLVIPGLDWNATDLDWLRGLQSGGAILAAHGWRHRAVPLPRTPAHRLHSVLLSRHAAEHLSRSPESVEAIMRRSADWFPAHGFAVPRLYVPPAWALGQADPAVLQALPFEMIETLSGLWLRNGAYHRLPLAGFEADTRFRTLALGFSNAVNAALARLTGRPLRLAIHPCDPDLRLHTELERRVARAAVYLAYTDLNGSSRNR